LGLSRVLVALPRGAGVVRLDDGDVVLCGDVRDGRGQPLHVGDRYRPIMIWLDAWRCLVGGLSADGQ
jgi:hypothetical protein